MFKILLFLNISHMKAQSLSFFAMSCCFNKLIPQDWCLMTLCSDLAWQTINHHYNDITRYKIPSLILIDSHVSVVLLVQASYRVADLSGFIFMLMHF